MKSDKRIFWLLPLLILLFAVFFIFFRDVNKYVFAGVVVAFALYIMHLVMSLRSKNIRMTEKNLELAREHQLEQDRIAQMDDILKVLAEEYSALYRTEMKSGRTVAYSMDDFARETYGKLLAEGVSFFSVLSDEYIVKYVHPDDVHIMQTRCMQENLYRELAKQKSYSVYFRVKRQTEDYHNYKLHFLKIGPADSEPENLLVGFINRDQQVRLEEELKLAGEREARLEADMCTDTLTGLFNRRAYEEDWKRYSENPPESDYVYGALDVNGLKNINDTLGHEAGDELIAAAAACMKDVFQPYGRIYRTGGDEFAVMVFTGREHFGVLKEDFEEKLRDWHGKYISCISVSAGYVFRDEIDTAHISDMARIADNRMYQDKSRYYARNGIDRRGNQDAFRALSDTYRKIIKADILNDTCSVIRIEDDEKNLIREKISEWNADFVAGGVIAEEDREKFRTLTDMDYMRNYFRHSSVITIHYRRMIRGEMRNVLMEIIRSKDYSEENQTVYFYVKVIS